MGILSDVIQWRAQEDARQLRDISQIGGAVQNMVSRQRQSTIDELNRRNLESQIKARESSASFFNSFQQQGTSTSAPNASISVGPSGPTIKIPSKGEQLLQDLKIEEQRQKSFDRTPAGRQQILDDKANATAVVASEKDRQLNLSKVRRLLPIIDNIEKKFLETKPLQANSSLAEFGLAPVVGAGAVVASNLQATPDQRTDLAYRKFVKGMRAQLARAMGDVGNLSEPEQKAAMELVPTLLDLRETGMEKVKNLRDFVKTLESRADSNAVDKINKVVDPEATKDFVDGKIYVDANGNRAIYENGQFRGL